MRRLKDEKEKLKNLHSLLNDFTIVVQEIIFLYNELNNVFFVISDTEQSMELMVDHYISLFLIIIIIIKLN